MSESAVFFITVKISHSVISLLHLSQYILSRFPPAQDLPFENGMGDLLTVSMVENLNFS